MAVFFFLNYAELNLPTLSNALLYAIYIYEDHIYPHIISIIFFIILKKVKKR
jgi:hypothetical protein